MAVAAHRLSSSNTSGGSTVYETPSISPNPNRLILCDILVSVAASPTPTVTVTGCGVTWVPVINTSLGTSVPEQRGIYRFRAMGTPTAGPLTVNLSAAANAFICQIFEFSGVNTSGTNGSGAVGQSFTYRSSGNVSSVSQPFPSAVTAGNATYAGVGLASVQEVLIPGTNWTSVEQMTVTGPQSSFMNEFAATAQQNVTASFTTPNNAFFVATEIIAGSGDTTAPSVPGSVTATINGDGKPLVSWSASTDNVAVANYRVRRDGVNLATAVTGTSYVDTSAAPGTAYSYTVSAADAAGNRSAESAAANVVTPAASSQLSMWNGTTLVPVTMFRWDGNALVPLGNTPTGDTEPPSTPTGVTATAISPTEVRVAWNPSTDNVVVDGYRIRRNGVVIADATGTSYNDTSVSPSTSYSYTLQAYDESSNDSAESTVATVTTPAPTDTTKPSVPTGVTATAVSSDQIDVTWNASTDNVRVSHYVVLRNGSVIDPRVTGTQFSSTGLTASTLYSHTIQAVDTSGNVSAESVAAAATTKAQSTTPGPVPTGDFILGVTAAQIQSLPKTGPEWERLKSQANGPYTVIEYDGKTDGSGNCVAGALYYVATGDTNYRNKVIAALNEVMSKPMNYNTTSGWQHAAVARKLGGWALAGDLVGHKTTAWHSFLRTMLTHDTGTHGRNTPLSKVAWHWDNNHGGAGMLAYVFICAVLGIKSETIGGYPGGLAAANKWLRGFCGDRSAAGFGHTRSTNPSYGSMGSTGEAIDKGWHMDENRPYGIGPTTAMWGSTVPSTREGAVPSDAVRGTTASHPTVGGEGRHYVPGNAGRRTLAAVVLAAQGYPDIWTVGDHALYRWRAWFERMYGDIEGAAHYAYDPIIKKVYRSKFDVSGFQHIPSGSGETITGTDWLALIPNWPIRPSTLP